MDSITLHQHFNCFVVAFECNPDCIKECNKNLEGKGYPITLVEKAVHEENKYLHFRPFDRKKYDNIGASSLFEIDFTTNRSIHDVDYGKKDVQNLIEVEAIRLDKYIDETGYKPNLICMDIQEAELIALKGLGDKIKDVKYIIFEASSVNTYVGGCDFFDIHNYLEANNFKFVKSSSNCTFPKKCSKFSFSDYLYINNIYT